MDPNPTDLPGCEFPAGFHSVTDIGLEAQTDGCAGPAQPLPAVDDVGQNLHDVFFVDGDFELQRLLESQR